MPENQSTFFTFCLIEWHPGLWRVKKIQEKKERHKWANQVMDELVRRTSSYKYRNTGQNPQETQSSKDEEECEVPNPALLEQASPSSSDHESNSRNTNVEMNSSKKQNNYQIGSDQNEQGELISHPFSYLHCKLH